MELKLVIVPEGAGNNKVHEFSNWDELAEFVEIKVKAEPKVKVVVPKPKAAKKAVKKAAKKVVK